jgi:hypothetical protein
VIAPAIDLSYTYFGVFGRPCTACKYLIVLLIFVFLDGRLRGSAMLMVEVDGLNAEAAQAGFYRGTHKGRAAPFSPQILIDLLKQDMRE